MLIITLMAFRTNVELPLSTFSCLIGHDTLSVSPKKRSVTKGYYETSSGIDAPEGSKAASYTLTETTVNV